MRVLATNSKSIKVRVSVRSPCQILATTLPSKMKAEVLAESETRREDGNDMGQYDLRVTSNASTFAFHQFLDVLSDLDPNRDSPQRVLIDLASPRFFSPGGIVPLIALIDDLAAANWEIDVQCPTGDHMAHYWESTGWKAAIHGDPPPKPSSRTTYTPLESYSKSYELNEIVNTVMDVLSKVTEYPTGVLGSVEWILQEIADNVLVHSQAKGWVQTVSRPEKGLVDLIVVDRGLGILRTLSQAFPQLQSDEEALKLAINQGVTRDKSVGQGNGLAGSIRIAEAMHGWVNIMSGAANLRLFDDGRFDSEVTKPYQGTIVSITLPTNAGVDLSTALWGYEPMRVFETTHVTTDGILFKLIEETTGFGNRGSGEEVATKLRNIALTFPDDRVIIDFTGIDVPSASFLDEFLAKTIKSEGVATFFRRFQLENMNSFVQRTADEVIAQRLSESKN